jgi:phosphotransferase system HPr-like phosphotransfer protein
LGAYKVDIFHSEDKLKVHTKSSFKLMNLDVDYNDALAFMGVNLVALI